MTPFFLMGNWKQNGSRRMVSEFSAQLREMLLPLQSTKLILALPFTYLSQAKALFMDLPINLGAQMVSPYAGGEHTGEISAAMLEDHEVTHCIVGHSERRRDFQEAGAQIEAQCKQLWSSNITPVLCFGEKETEVPLAEVIAALTKELQGILSNLGEQQRAQTWLAYEPVWAIGQTTPASCKHITAVIEGVRKGLESHFGKAGTPGVYLYGGSVKLEKAEELLQAPIQGFLVGSASLDAKDFSSLASLVDQA